jgi:hypothetical protein
VSSKRSETFNERHRHKHTAGQTAGPGSVNNLPFMMSQIPVTPGDYVVGWHLFAQASSNRGEGPITSFFDANLSNIQFTAVPEPSSAIPLLLVSALWACRWRSMQLMIPGKGLRNSRHHPRNHRKVNPRTLEDIGWGSVSESSATTPGNSQDVSIRHNRYPAGRIPTLLAFRCPSVPFGIVG